jgi:putative membrane protein
MAGFFVRVFVNMLGIWLASEIVPGIQVSGASTLLAAALVLGIVNALVRPIAVVLTFPITIVSLGLFLLVINAGMLGLVARLVTDFQVRDFGSAFLGALIVSVVGWVSTRYIGPRGGIEIAVIERRSRP